MDSQSASPAWLQDAQGRLVLRSLSLAALLYAAGAVCFRVALNVERNFYSGHRELLLGCVGYCDNPGIPFIVDGKSLLVFIIPMLPILGMAGAVRSGKREAARASAVIALPVLLLYGLLVTALFWMDPTNDPDPSIGRWFALSSFALAGTLGSVIVFVAATRKPGGSRMSRWKGIGSVLVAACLLGMVAAVGVLVIAQIGVIVSAVDAGPSPTGVVYSTNFRHGDRGWPLDNNCYPCGHWSTGNGQLIYSVRGVPSGDDAQTLMMAPFRTTGRENFTVAARIRLLRVLTNLYNVPQFGILVHSDGTILLDQIVGEVRSPSDAALLMGPCWDSACQGQMFGEGTFDPGKGWHTYRLEARGARFRLRVDGRLVVRGRIRDTWTLGNDQVGLIVNNDEIAISSFKVIYP